MKYLPAAGDGRPAESHPARGAWIEIGIWRGLRQLGGVAPRKGCVD